MCKRLADVLGWREDFVSIANREERKEALIKYFEKVIKDLKEV